MTTPANGDRGATPAPPRGNRLWIAVVPVAVLLYGFGLQWSYGPTGVRDLDPGDHYLFNALNLVEGYPISHIDHPGTPVQEIGALAILATHVVSGSGPVAADLIERPRAYVAAFFAALVVVYAVALLALGWVAWRHTGRVGAAMAIALMPQLAGNLIWLAPINAESLLVSVVTAERARG